MSRSPAVVPGSLGWPAISVWEATPRLGAPLNHRSGDRPPSPPLGSPPAGVQSPRPVLLTIGLDRLSIPGSVAVHLPPTASLSPKRPIPRGRAPGLPPGVGFPATAALEGSARSQGRRSRSSVVLPSPLTTTHSYDSRSAVAARSPPRVAAHLPSAAQ